jgi:hypothetical protein
MDVALHERLHDLFEGLAPLLAHGGLGIEENRTRFLSCGFHAQDREASECDASRSALLISSSFPRFRPSVAHAQNLTPACEHR